MSKTGKQWDQAGCCGGRPADHGAFPPVRARARTECGVLADFTVSRDLSRAAVVTSWVNGDSLAAELDWESRLTCSMADFSGH